MDRRIRYVLSVVAGGIVGHAVAAAAGGLMLEDVGMAEYLLDPGRTLAALVAAAALPTIHLRLPAIVEDVVAMIWLTTVASVTEKLVFGAADDWGVAVMVGAIFAAVALFAYRLAAEWGREEHD